MTAEVSVSASTEEGQRPRDAVRGDHISRTRMLETFVKLPGRVRRLFDLAGGRWAFAWSSYAYLIVPAILAVAALEAPTGFEAWQLFLVGFLGVFSALVCGLLVLVTLLRDREDKPVEPWKLLVYWGSAGLGLGLSRALCTFFWTDADPQWTLRIIGSVAGSCVWVSAISVVQAMLDDRRTRLDELESIKRRMARIRESAESTLAELIAALSSAVRTAVEPHIIRLNEQLISISNRVTRNNLKTLAADIQRVASDVVRLTSHQMLEPGSLDPFRIARTTRVFDSVVLDVLKRPIMWPWVGSLMLIVGTGPEIYRTSGVGTTLIGVTGVTAATFVLMAIERLSVRRSDRAAAFIQWGSLLAVCAVVGIVPPLLEGIASVKFSTQLAPILMFVPLVALGSLMTSVAVSTRRQSIRLMGELAYQNEELQAAAQAIELEADDVRRRVAALLHGPVQGRLSAASMLLSLHVAGQSGRSVDQVIDEVEALIQAAHDDLATLSSVPQRRPTARAVLAGLHQDWTGIVEVTGTVDPDAERLLAGDRALSAAVNEILVDMVTNAARHGRARRADITVGLGSMDSGDRVRQVVEIRGVNDGSFSPAKSQGGGFVDSLLASMGGDWTVGLEDELVVSLARVPMRLRRPEAVGVAAGGTVAEYAI